MNSFVFVGLVAVFAAVLIACGYLFMGGDDCAAAHYAGFGSITVAEIGRRLAAESSADRVGGQANMWLSAWSHSAPEGVLTAAQAHDVMRLHRECQMRGCARKRAAYWALVDAGRVRPDVRAERWGSGG
ncbi:hypothetical protein ABZ319_09365 [Nocardia sp. NPDC005978]|uniref:hypothetical protein n=1 Tax=Nocardia sp. NPDC005978 TaxID=3156725 RepID=UPI0033B8BA48